MATQSIKKKKISAIPVLQENILGVERKSESGIRNQESENLCLRPAFQVLLQKPCNSPRPPFVSAVNGEIGKNREKLGSVETRGGIY